MARRGWRDLDGPKPLSAALDKVTGRLTVADAGSLTALVDRWEELVGTELAAGSTPTKVLEGTVTVACGDALTATSLKLAWRSIGIRATELGLDLPGVLEAVIRTQRAPQ